MKKIFFALVFAVLLLGCAGLEKPIKENNALVNHQSSASQDLVTEVGSDDSGGQIAQSVDVAESSSEKDAVATGEKQLTAFPSGTIEWCVSGDSLQVKGVLLTIVGFENFGEENLQGKICHLSGNDGTQDVDYFVDDVSFSNLKGEATAQGNGCISYTNRDDPQASSESCFGDMEST